MSETTEDIQRAIKILSEPKDSRLITNLNSCVHCGLCAESCMYFLTTNDERLAPAS